MDKKVAIVGSGISGLAAAYTLRKHCRLTLFEQNAHLGGHAHSITLQHGGSEQNVDIAFMVYNRRNYPHFCALLDALNISGDDTDMSFSVVHEHYDITYNGGSLAGLFSDKRNLLRPIFWRLLRDIVRFNRLAKHTLRHNTIAKDITLTAFLQQHRLPPIFTDTYLLPMGASIWSCSTDEFAQSPAWFVLAFFNNHGLLDLTNRPQWQHIRGGSRRYVEALINAIPALSCRHEAVSAVGADGSVTCANGGSSEYFDAVILATHAPQALALLTAPSEQQQSILGAFRYTHTTAVLHTDTRLLPAPATAHAAWNYRVSGSSETAVAYPTYSLSLLQHLTGAPLLFTLNPPPHAIRPDTIIDTFSFSHPLPTPAAIKAQQRFDELNRNGTLYFCGAYWGNGFHEDGAVSGEAAAKQLLATAAV